jgi:deoxyribodipyrimidine photo-lyase
MAGPTSSSETSAPNFVGELNDTGQVTAPTIVWFRRDLRVADQPALSKAVNEANATDGSVLPVFILDPKLGSTSGPNRLAFLYDALRSLRNDGVPLVIRLGDPLKEIPALAAEFKATRVHVSADFGPYGRIRDDQVAAALKKQQRELVVTGSSYVIDPGTVRKGDGTPFKVFTPFKRVWELEARNAAPGKAIDPHLAPWWRDVVTEEIPQRPSKATGLLPEATEAAAHERLKTFLKHNLADYDAMRNDPGADATSRLSADLKYGLLHPRQILPSLRQPGTGPDVFRTELCWREFYADVLWHQPHTARHALVTAMEGMRVDTGPTADERFDAWCLGRTGFPFIDAGMRQLLAEGWMHNRVRMAVASFLVKDLHLDWRRGASWFMRHLVDGDLASNQHGWQWTAGTGTDASPYFRVFNPISQGKKFDPHGVYVRRYVPELASLADKFIHEPWLAPSAEPTSLFDDAGAPTASSYPAPIVDHAAERIESLARYAEVRGR